MARQIEEREAYESLEKHEFEWTRSTAYLAKYAHAARQAEVIAKMKQSLLADSLGGSRQACEAFQKYFPSDPQANEVAKALENAKEVERLSEIGNILLPLMPQMYISSQSGATLKSEKTEDDVLPEVTRLLREGADPLRVKIVGFSKPKVERMGIFASKTSSGLAGRVVSVDDPRDGITLLAYCESVNCWKIASAFMAYNSQRNALTMKTDAQLAQLSGAAAKGDIAAQKRLATMLLNGTPPLHKDIATAIKYYEMAATQNDAEAERLLGNIYSEQGSVKSSKQAVEWYNKSTAKRDAQAMYELGLCYQSGFGVEKDMKKAIEFFTQSMELGCADAQNIIGYFLFGGEHLAKDQGRAITLWEKAAAQNHAMAMCSLGWSYQQGEGVAKDLEKARSWYRRAIECSTGESNAYARKLLEQMD
jgi:TPR repeat protein